MRIGDVVAANLWICYSLIACPLSVHGSARSALALPVSQRAVLSEPHIICPPSRGKCPRSLRRGRLRQVVDRGPGLAPAKAVDVVVVPVDLAVLDGFKLRNALAVVVGLGFVVGLSFAVGVASTGCVPG